jgi:hypothetical protein
LGTPVPQVTACPDAGALMSQAARAGAARTITARPTARESARCSGVNGKGVDVDGVDADGRRARRMAFSTTDRTNSIL